MKVQCMVSFGGTNVRDDVYRLMNVVHVLVGTVGRLFDLVNKKAADLSHCNIIVLDEADKILSSEMLESVS